MRNYRTSIVLLVILFSVLVAVEYYQPKALDWRPTFSNKDKIPYGTYVLYQLLPDLFREQEITTVRLPIANQLENNSAKRFNYIFIHRRFVLDSLDQQTLLQHVSRGNRVFIAAEYFTDSFRKALHFNTRFNVKNSIKKRLGVYFTNPKLGKQQLYYFNNDKAVVYFTLRKAAPGLALGKDSAGQLNFISIPYGRGMFYLNTVPSAFTNYYVLSPQHGSYAATALSYLPVQSVLWDEYQKQGAAGNESVFRVLLAHPPLRWAYYLTLAGLLLYVVFEGKRTQRIIPILPQPANETVDFVRVVGSLYFHNRNHKNIADKKIRYFFEYLRLHFYDPTPGMEPEALERVAVKSGVSLPEVKALFDLIQKVNQVASVSDDDLGQLNQQLEAFYGQTKR